MSVFIDIRAALQLRAETTPGLPILRAPESVDANFNPGTSYVAFTLIPASERPSSLGPDGFVQAQGIFQIGLFFPSGKGTGAVEAMADAVKAKFKPGTSLGQGPTLVRIDYAERRQALIDSAWVHVPVDIGWRSHYTP